MSEQVISSSNGKHDLIKVNHLMKYFPVRGGLMPRVMAWVLVAAEIGITVRERKKSVWPKYPVEVELPQFVQGWV